MYSISAATDDSGTIIERYRYTAYGFRQVISAVGALLSGTAIGNPWAFEGRQQDEETGLLYFRTRYLDPILGRFLNRMPWFRAPNVTNSNYEMVLMSPNWRMFMGAFLLHGYGAYFQDRYNVYDFAFANPSNVLEPFSGGDKKGGGPAHGTGNPNDLALDLSLRAGSDSENATLDANLSLSPTLTYDPNSGPTERLDASATLKAAVTEGDLTLSLSAMATDQTGTNDRSLSLSASAELSLANEHGTGLLQPLFPAPILGSFSWWNLVNPNYYFQFTKNLTVGVGYTDEFAKGCPSPEVGINVQKKF